MFLHPLPPPQKKKPSVTHDPRAFSMRLQSLPEVIFLLTFKDSLKCSTQIDTYPTGKTSTCIVKLW